MYSVQLEDRPNILPDDTLNAEDNFGMEHCDFLAGLSGSLITIIILAIIHLIQHIISKKAEKGTWLVLLVLVTTGITCFMVAQQMAKVEQIYSRERLSVRFFGVDGPINCFDEARRLVHETSKGSQVLVVNYFPYEDLKNEQTESSRRDYMHEIEAKLGQIDYHRIIQLPTRTLGTNLRDVVGARYLNHFQSVVESRDSKKLSGRVQLQQVEALYPMTFVIIKNPNKTSHLILEVRNVDAKGVQQAIGALIVTDPEDEVVPYFESLYYQLANNPDIKSIRVEQLL